MTIEILTTGTLLHPSTPEFGEVQNLLHYEALLLDEDRHEEWLELLTDDIVYQQPSRKSLYRIDGPGFDPANGSFDDIKMTLAIRARRSVGITTAYDRDPPAQMRRVVSNLLVYRTEDPNEYLAKSYISLFRNRFDDPRYDMLTARRDDIVRDVEGEWKLARRLILVDQVLPEVPYYNVFL